MSITAYQTTQLGQATQVTVSSDLGGTIYYHWYLDGAHVGSTRAASRTFLVSPDEQVRVEVIDTNDPDFDPIENAPDGWPARRRLWWLRSIDAGADRYRVEQRQTGGAWSSIGEATPQPGQWEFFLLTPRLDDLTEYSWRVIPVDAAGNDGAPRAIGPEKIVRTPDAPRFSIDFDDGTTKVTFAEAT